MTYRPIGRFEIHWCGWDTDHKFCRTKRNRAQRKDGKLGIRQLLRGNWQRAAQHMPL